MFYRNKTTSCKKFVTVMYMKKSNVNYSTYGDAYGIDVRCEEIIEKV